MKRKIIKEQMQLNFLAGAIGCNILRIRLTFQGFPQLLNQKLICARQISESGTTFRAINKFTLKAFCLVPNDHKFLERLAKTWPNLYLVNQHLL